MLSTKRKNKTEENKESMERATVFKRPVMESLIEKVTFKQRHEEDGKTKDEKLK